MSKRAKLFTSVIAFTTLFHGLVWAGTPLRVTEVYEAYLKLPARGKNDPCLIEVVPFYKWSEKPHEMDRWTLAYYRKSTDQMTLRGDLDPKTFRVVVAHEFGHHVYFVTFTTKEMTEWQTFWDKNLIAMPRDYARYSASEGWAECYSVRFIGSDSYLYSPELKFSPAIIAEIDRLTAQPAKKTEAQTLEDWICKTK